MNAIDALKRNFNFIGFALGNNHITDFVDVISTTNKLDKLNIPYCGIGNNIKDACSPLVLSENGIQIVILNFGWEVIQCEIATSRNAGVNPLTKRHVLDSIREAVLTYPEAKIVPYMHWSYELEGV